MLHNYAISASFVTVGSYFIISDSWRNGDRYVITVCSHGQDAELIFAQFLGHMISQAHRVDVALRPISKIEYRNPQSPAELSFFAYYLVSFRGYRSGLQGRNTQSPCLLPKDILTRL